MTRRLAALLLLLSCSWPALADQVTIQAAGGPRLHAQHLAAEGSKSGVVLVHMEGRKAADWRFLAKRLQRSGLSTLAVDLRGHGANVPEGQAPPELTDADYQAMRADVEAAVAWLRSHGAENLSIVGAGVGANLALEVAAGDPGIGNLVLLSPGLSYHGVETPEALQAYGDRPLLLVASEEDAYSAKSCLLLDAQARGQHHFELYKAAGHGTRMLNEAPALEPLIQSWLLGSWRLSSEEGAARGIKTGDTTPTETTGEKLPTHR